MLLKRELYLSKIRPYYELDLIKVIAGIRRSGKSKLLELIRNELRENGVPSHRIIYINFEDIEFDYISDAQTLNSAVKSKIQDEGKYYLLLDELQHVSSFEKALASFKATLNCSIFVTGSNSRLLSGELSTLLTGRTVEFLVLPLSYKEAREYITNLNRPIPQDFFYNYLKWGGFPQRFEFDNDEQIRNYLVSIYTGIIERDIFQRDGHIDRHKFRAVCSYVLANAGKEFSGDNVANYFNQTNKANQIDITKPTVYNYLSLMEKAFFISRVKRFDISGKKVLRTMEKFYSVDTGLRIINTNTINYEDTFFLENIVYNELISRGYDVYAGKTFKGEVDFVAAGDGKKCFIQVSYLMQSQATIDREFEAFDAIKDAAPKYVMSLDKIDLSRGGITHLNIEDFLLRKREINLS
jgi:predicted AAA+ superfamily ATPase